METKIEIERGEIGKATALTRLKTHLCKLQAITKCGLSGSLEEALPVARRYALLLYGQKKKLDGHPTWMC